MEYGSDFAYSGGTPDALISGPMRGSPAGRYAEPMARKARSGITGGQAAFRRGQKVRRRTQFHGEGYGRRTAGGRTRLIVKPARRTGRGVRSFATGLHPRAANGRFRRR